MGGWGGLRKPWDIPSVWKGRHPRLGTGHGKPLSTEVRALQHIPAESAPPGMAWTLMRVSLGNSDACAYFGARPETWAPSWLPLLPSPLPDSQMSCKDSSGLTLCLSFCIAFPQIGSPTSAPRNASCGTPPSTSPRNAEAGPSCGLRGGGSDLTLNRA